MTSVIQPMDKGVIKNLKHFYRRFLVENILTGDSEALKIKLDVLQASRLCKKAWDQVTSETIKHCFKKAGFVKKEEDEENADDIIAEMMPSVDGWEDVISNPTISYDDFLNVDDDVAVCGEITDADIIAEVLNHNIEKQDGDEASGDEDESSVAGEMNVPSAAEATNYIMQLRRFFESKNDICPVCLHPAICEGRKSGRTWIRHLKINLEEIDQENLNQIKELKVSSINDDYDIEKKFPDIYTQKVGCVPDFLITLQLRQGAKPSFTPERNVPYALREKVEKELDTLEAEGIISKAATSDWGSPLVVIPKGDGTVRLCVDYKVGVNDQLVNASYPIKIIEDVLNSLKDSKYFCRLDLYKAYLHLRTDEESSIIQTISTHRGTYRMNRIFHPKSKFPKMTSARLLRYASFLAGFDYVVSFKKGTENQIADCLSRAPTAQGYVTTDMIINEEVHRICSSTVFEISTKTLTVEEIVKETDKDKELSKLKRDIKSNSIESDYTINGEIFFKNDKVVVPKSLQLEVLKDLHSTHLGIVKMKHLARRYCTWENIDKDIENLVKSCKDCLSTQNNPPKAPVHHWDPPSTNWERIHLDYAGPFQGYYYLVLIDAKSRWAEIKAISEPPTTLNTIKLLNDIFSTHGYPFVMVSDNASIFTGDTFSNYCLENGIRQKFIAPGHPATNGLAERNVQTLKNKLKSMINENVPIHQKIQKILLRYRATPLASGRSPSEMYLNRQIRKKPDAMRPYQEEKSQQQIQPRTRCLQVGERVQARVFISNKPFWKNGTIKQKLGNLHYIIELDEGKSLKPHINQLQKVETKKKQVTFDESTIHHQSKPSQSSPDFDPIQYTVSQPEPNQQEHHDPDQTSDQEPTSMPDTPLRRSQRPRRPPRHLEDYVYTTRNIKTGNYP
ncbi:K02A2.6-like [Cordylochernes scorpioides]|uniref:RNA-directed DNA polymerase n=1 Tax=Cordylochernes scorpioides TaxID=51811 RepID=A0ABY6LDI2_9ARAC|nr:K02A2.6-like [Cordylochernes scorpioides]